MCYAVIQCTAVHVHGRSRSLSILYVGSGTLAHQQPIASSTRRTGNPDLYSILATYTISLLGIGSGNASSLPLRVLRSMLKQRRILMRMH